MSHRPSNMIHGHGPRCGRYQAIPQSHRSGQRSISRRTVRRCATPCTRYGGRCGDPETGHLHREATSSRSGIRQSTSETLSALAVLAGCSDSGSDSDTSATPEPPASLATCRADVAGIRISPDRGERRVHPRGERPRLRHSRHRYHCRHPLRVLGNRRSPCGTMITASVATGSVTSTAITTDEIEAMASAVTRNHFAYWDADGNGDPTCAEAWSKDDGPRLPA